MNKYKLYMILGIIVLVLSVSSSFAYYIWKSTSNALVNLNVCTPTITFAGGSTINGVDMIPVLTKEEGTIKDLEVKKNSTCNRDVTMNLYLELTTFPTELAESSFVYELYKNSETMAIASGNFSNKEQGNTITLLSNQILNTSKDTYTLYIYIDGNVDNPSASTSKFFNTEVMREEIQSLTIAEDNTVPDTPGVVSKDISQNKDGTVMLWYTPKEVASSDGSTKTMYDMWIGGENGVLQTGTNASGMFAYLTNIEKLDLSKLDTSYITNMSKMFYMSSGLKSIDLSNFNTSKVTDMSHMFDGCSNLTDLDLSSFNTSKVTSMYWMFSNLKKVTSLDLSNFDTKMVTNMFGLFRYCSSLKELDVSNFNTSMVKTMTGMFLGCKSLIKLDLSNFDTSNVTDMSSIFQECTNLKELNLSSFNTSNVTNMRSMFQNCGSLTNIDVSSFDTSKVVNMSYMFSGVIVRTLDLLNFDTSKVTIMSNMFGDAKILSINLSSFDTSSVTDMSSMFYGCKNLTKLDLSNFDTSKVTKTGSPYGMFYGCSNLKTIYVSDLWNMNNVTKSENMFRACTSLTGAVPFDSTKTDATMANYITGYLTYKSNN